MGTTRFEKGQPVRATTTAQGMKKGQLYRVLDINEIPTFAGAIVQYQIQAEGEAPIWIGNGHLLLTEVDTSSAGAIMGLWSEGGKKAPTEAEMYRHWKRGGRGRRGVR